MAGTTALALGVAAPASAQVAPIKPLRIVVSGPSTIVRFNALPSRPTSARGDFFAEVCHREIGATPVVCNGKWSDTPTVAFTLPLLSSDLVLGSQRWEVEDGSDGKVTGIAVSVVRESKIVTGKWVPIGVPGVIAGSAVLTHYDTKTYRFTPAPSSPVNVQVLDRSGWRTVASWTTDVNGLAHGTAKIGAATKVRIIRPEGSRDAAVTGMVASVRS